MDFVPVSEEKIKILAIKNKITQRDLCKKINVTENGLKKMLLRGNLKKHIAVLIAQTFNTSIENLNIIDNDTTYGQNDHKLSQGVESRFFFGNEGKSEGFVPMKVYEEAMQKWEVKEAFYIRTIDSLNDNLKKH